MNSQERALVQDLFDRLASLEGERRDPDAEQLIAQSQSRAPHATYALVQTVLVQDEALKRANARIEELQNGGGAEQPQGGFLDTVRNAMFGNETPARGSVPSVGGEPKRNVWGSGTTIPPQNGGGYPQQQGGFGQQGGYGQQGYAQQPAPGTGGGSFLGTAAASAAGVIGGAMLMNSISSMFHGGGQAHSAFGGGGGGGYPGAGDSRGSDVARDAGLNDIGGGGGGSIEDRRGERAGFFGGDDNAAGNDDDYDTADSGGDFGGGDFGGSDDA